MAAQRVDPILREIDAPYVNNQDLREARSELAAAACKRLPSGSRVFTPTIERTDAGRAQASAVSPTHCGFPHFSAAWLVPLHIGF